MKYNKDNIIIWLTDNLSSRGIRHEVHQFHTGYVMADVWYNYGFYVVQLGPDILGFSEVDDDIINFDTKPDKSFNSPDEFKAYISSVFLF